MQKYIPLFLMLFMTSLLALAGTSCSYKTRHLTRANQYYDAGEYDKAELEYINVLRKGPNPLAYKRLGLMYFADGRVASAAGILLRAQSLATNDLEVRDKLALMFLSLGDAKRARAEAKFVLDHNPDDQSAPLIFADAITSEAELQVTRSLLEKIPATPSKRAVIEVALGNLALRERDYHGAQEAFQRAQALDPKVPELYAAVGNFYLMKQDNKLADQSFKKAADLAPPRSPIRLKYAEIKLRENDTAESETILKAIVKDTPDYLPAHLLLAQVYIAEKKYSEAEEALNLVLAVDGQNYEAINSLGKVAVLQNDYAKAQSVYERAIRIYPKNPQLHYQLGLIYQKNNDPEKATGSLNRALALQTNMVDAVMALDEIKIQQGSLGAAVGSLKDIVKQQPKNIPAQLLLASAYQRQGNLDGALKIYVDLEKIAPTNAQLAVLEGNLFRHEGKTAAAREHYEKAHQLAPELLPPLERLVDFDLAEKKYPAALQQLQSQLEKYPQEQSSRMLMARVYLAQGDTNQAEACLEKAVQAKPDYTQGNLVLAQLYEGGGQYQKALACLKKVLAKEPDNVMAWMRMGMVQADQDDYAKARDSYEKVLAINPKFSSALNNLAWVYADKLGDLDRAYGLARRLRDMSPPDPSTAPYAADTLGWILYKKGDYSRALPLLQEAAASLSNHAEVQYHLGVVAYMNGQEEIAQKALEEAIKSGDKFSGKEQIPGYLAILAIDPQTTSAGATTALEKSVAQNPQDLGALRRLAVIYRRQGASDKAIKSYEQILKVVPKNVNALIQLARLDSAKPKEVPAAFELAKQAYNLSPTDPVVSHYFGRLSYLTGNYERAASVLEQSSTLQPNDPEVLFDLSLARYSVGQTANADSAMQAALQANPSFPRANDARRFLELRALAANPPAGAVPPQVADTLKADPDNVAALMIVAAHDQRKPDAKAAKATYEKILSHFPGFTPAKRELAILYSQDETSNDKAYPIAVSAREAFPADASVAKALGILSYRKGDFSRAEQLLTESNTAAKGNAQLFYYLGMAQARLKKKAASKKNLQHALDLHLPEEQAQQAKSILAATK